MKYKELVDLEDKKLEEQLLIFKKERFNIRMQKVSNSLENPARISQIKRDIARIRTLQTKRIEKNINYK